MNALLLMIALVGDDRVASNLEDRELRSSSLPPSGHVLLADGTQPDGGKKKKKKKNGEESEEERAPRA